MLRLISLLTVLYLALARNTLAAEIPVNIGVGPSAFYVPEHLDDRQPEPFYGLRLHIKAVIDRDALRKNKNKIPAQYRAAVEKVDEVRVGYLLVPETIMIGPRRSPHGPEIYGASWRPLAIDLPLKLGPTRLSIGTGLMITYAYVNTGDYRIVDQTDKELKDLGNAAIKYRAQTTHFLRPGADLNAEYEVKFSSEFLMSLGWSSAFYVPQEIGGPFFSLGADDLQKSLWRVHQAYLVLHYRMPVQVSL